MSIMHHIHIYIILYRVLISVIKRMDGLYEEKISEHSLERNSTR